MICKYVLPFWRLPFISFMIYFALQKFCLFCIFQLSIVPVIPLVYFCFFLTLLLVSNPKILSPRPLLRSLPPVFSSKSFTVSGIMSRPLTYFELFLVYDMRYWSSFPNTIYWRDSLFPTVYLWLFCCKFVDHICMGLFCFTDLYVCFYVNIILFWLL